MSNTKNLANLASVLSDGASGQVLQSTGSGGVAFADAGAGGSGVTTYTAKSGTDGTPTGATYIDNVSSPSEGDLAYDLAADQLYIRTTSAWKRVSIGVDESPVITTEPPTSHDLNGDGSTSTVTMVAYDPEGFGITYGIAYPTANNALPNQLAAATSINQSTGVFTFDPSTDTANDAGTVKVRLSASDGISTTTRFVSLTLSAPAFFGDRAIFFYGTSANTIEYFSLVTTGTNAADFGDATTDGNYLGSVSNSTRVVRREGATLDYVTVATTGNATDFGDTNSQGLRAGGVSNGVKGLFAGSGDTTDIDVITIATTGNASDFGDLTVARGIANMAVSNATYGVFAGGYLNSSPYIFNTIDRVTIGTSGSASDFGDMGTATRLGAAAEDASRGVLIGGQSGPNTDPTNVISYITVDTAGNATDFGDLITAKYGNSATGNGTYAVQMGGGNAFSNTIEYITIQTTGNATDWGGDLGSGTGANRYGTASSGAPS
jgi:hypothetical protein